MSHTILLVEDDANIRQMLSIALGAEGYLCVEAASVREALSLFNQHRPDLVILDLGLPDGEGCPGGPMTMLASLLGSGSLSPG